MADTLATNTTIPSGGDVNKLPLADRANFISGWKSYLSKLPSAAYTAKLGQLTRLYGPDIASEIVQPEPVIQEPTTSPTALAQSPTPVTPWYKTTPFIKDIVSGAGLVASPFIRGLNIEQQKWINPAAFTVGKAFSPALRQELAGKSVWGMTPEQQQQIWEKSNIPWIGKIALQVAVDPLSYLGWGIPGALEKSMAARGLTGLAKTIAPVARAEEAFNVAAALPLKGAAGVARGISAGLEKLPGVAKVPIVGQRVAYGLLKESPKSIVSNTPRYVVDMLNSLKDAGEVTGKPFSQILEDFRLKATDPAILRVVTQPKQRDIISAIARNSDKLGLDELIKVADKHPDHVSSVLGARLAQARAVELALPRAQMLSGRIAASRSIASKVYNTWRRAVLWTPFYALQNVMEDPTRSILMGVMPVWDIERFAARADLALHPIDIQSRIISLADRFKNRIPEHITTQFARTPATGGITEAMMGSLARGKWHVPGVIGSYMDDLTLVNTYFNMYDKFTKTLMSNTSGETKVALGKLNTLFTNAAKQMDSSGKPLIDQTIVEHLHNTAINSPPEVFLNEINEVMRNKTLSLARPMNQAEKTLPDVTRSIIKNDLPRAWAKDDVKAISQIFERARKAIADYPETYQKQIMLQRIKEYRSLLRNQVPKNIQPLVTKVINSFKYERVAEREARLATAKTLTGFQQALFKNSVESRRELESLMEGLMISESIAKKVDGKTLANWYGISERINQEAFAAGEKLVDDTFHLSRVVSSSKDPSKIKGAWDAFIMEIQSEFPEEAALMVSATVPDNDLLWSVYRGIQEKRWFKVGQDKLNAMGLDMSKFPSVVGAGGKVLTMEDFMKSQLGIIDSWETRTMEAFEKRHTTPAPRQSLLDSLRGETLTIKESISLQEKQLQNQARDLALGVTYSEFGNYATRTNLDELMTSLGVPFWFFPSRSIPFYLNQMFQKPKLGIELLTLQQQADESNQPRNLFGSINIPGTNFYYNPLQGLMAWQLFGTSNFVPGSLPELERGQQWARNMLGVSLGPQWSIAAAIVSRVIGKRGGGTLVTGEPNPIIPQQKWLQALAKVDIPGISDLATLLNEPFDAYLRAVYGEEVANWQQREVEKYIVDMGYNPADPNLPDEIIQKAWREYGKRQLLSIPGGVVRELTPTEKARSEALAEEAKKLGLTQKQIVALRATGESPYTGLRQDQLEAIYKNIPAERLWQYIRPSGLTQESRPYWEDYIQSKFARQELLYGTDMSNPTKGSRLYNEQQYDKALQSNKITPREWKALYRQNYAEYANKIQQIEADYPLAPKTDADWEAYRKMLGWTEPVRHPDDIVLDAYYEALDTSDGKFDNPNVPGEFDYAAYRQVEANFLGNLSQSQIDYINSRKNKYKTPLRVAYGQDMVKVQPYYSIYDAMLAQYPPEIKAIIDYAANYPDATIQKVILSSNPVALMAMRRISLAKSRFLLQNPEIGRILRYWNS